MNEPKKETPVGPVNKEAILWKDNIGNRLLARAKETEEVFEGVLIDMTADGNFLRLQLDANVREWKAAKKYEIVQVLKAGTLEEMALANAQLQVKLGEQALEFQNLRTQIAELSAELAFECATNEPLKNACKRTRDDYNAAVKAEETAREEHEVTKRQRDHLITDLANVKGELDMEKAAHRKTIRDLTDRVVLAENSESAGTLKLMEELQADGVEAIEIIKRKNPDNLDMTFAVVIKSEKEFDTYLGRSPLAALKRAKARRELNKSKP